MIPQFQELKASLPSTYHFVDSVDHPVLLEGPDVLVGGDGVLISFYKAKKKGFLSLRARVAASKLALPSHCLHIFIAETESMGREQIEESGQVFDHTIEIGDLTRASLMRERPSARVTNELSRIKKLQGQLYSRTLQFATARRKHQRDDGSSSRIAHHLHEGSPKTSGILSYKGIDLSAREQPATLQYLKQLCQIRFSEYIFDNNVPYPKTMTPGIAISDAIPELKNDPEKPLRAASFSGWIVTDASSIQDLDAIITRAGRFGFTMP